MREFEVGEIVHILDDEPPEEQVETEGCELLNWSDTTRLYAGREARILKQIDEYQKYGWMYRLEFFDDDEKEDFYGIDLVEFYGQPTPVITPEALITLLG